MVIDARSIPLTTITWSRAVRIINSAYPPIDLFEDIADPADWSLLIAAEQKTNPRLMENIGNIDLVPPERRVGGSGSSYLMAPFTHVSTDRPSRFSSGEYGVLYVGRTFEVALFETMHHHAEFMKSTDQPPGWASQFREITLDVDAELHDIRSFTADSCVFHTSDYSISQSLGQELRSSGSNGIAYPSVRQPGEECAALFYPDCGSDPKQGRHLDYHWNGEKVDLYRDAGNKEVFRVVWQRHDPPRSAAEFLVAVLNLPEVRGLLSAEHFSVDGTLIQA